MISVWWAMAGFALAMSISPGPVNMVIVASGAQHGAWRTLPFVSGATIGFTLLLVLVGLGLNQVFTMVPWLLAALGWGGTIFIVYLGYRIATAEPEAAGGSRGAPSFWQGCSLQWLNPKAWIACASGVAMFSSPDSPGPLSGFIGLYFVICYASLAVWAVAGERVATLLDSAARWRVFNALMGSLLAGTAIYMLLAQ